MTFSQMVMIDAGMIFNSNECTLVILDDEDDLLFNYSSLEGTLIIPKDEQKIDLRRFIKNPCFFTLDYKVFTYILDIIGLNFFSYENDIELKYNKIILKSKRHGPSIIELIGIFFPYKRRIFSLDIDNYNLRSW